MFKPIPVAIGLRYLRAKRRNGFISFISGVSMLGIGLGVAALIYNLNVGLVSITVAVALALLSPQSQKGAVDGISW